MNASNAVGRILHEHWRLAIAAEIRNLRKKPEGRLVCRLALRKFYSALLASMLNQPGGEDA